MRKDYDIVGSYNNQRISPIDSERTVNLFEYLDPNGKRPKTLIPTSGLIDTELDFGPETGGSRASFVFKDAIYQVFGGTVFKISGPTDNLSRTVIGTLTTSVGHVGVDANAFQILFVDGSKGYIFDTNTSIFKEITDPAFPERPIDCTFLDGFFVVINGQTNEFELSEFNQGLIWGPDNTGSESTFTMAAGSANLIITFAAGFSVENYQIGTPVTFTGGGLPVELIAGNTYYVKEIINATTITVSATNNGVAIVSAAGGNGTLTNNGQLQLGTVTSHPGTLVGCRTLHRRLFLFSQNFTEVWENAGSGTNLPFRRNNSLLMEVGTPAVGSIATGFDSMFFLSQDKDGLGSVMEVKGSESMPVSNRALDFQLAQYAADQTLGVSNVADAKGILIKENGLIFYRLNFTNANHTFVLNASMSEPGQPRWHEEEILNGNRHPAQTHAFYNGTNYYGDYQSSVFYSIDPNVWTNNGEAIRRMRIAKPMAPEGYNRIRIDRMHLDLLQGTIAEKFLDENILSTESGLDIITEKGDDILVNQQVLISGDQPYVFFSYSKDGGQSYGNVIQSPMGKTGERTFRTVWRKLGTIPRGQSFVPKFEFYSNAPFVVLGAAWDFEILPE